MGEETQLHDYSKGVAHYLSPARRDAVKLFWEEPFSQGIYTEVFQNLAKGQPSDWMPSVLDLGCGTGDGLRLLTAALKSASKERQERRISYLGLDFSDEMVATARETHRGKRGVLFRQGDMRSDLPPEPFDLYFSCGVPYSHLSVDDFRDVLTGILKTARGNGQMSALVVDVLGRFSLEWCSKWNRTDWMYRMSFFKSSAEEQPTRMFFYDKRSLKDLVEEAAALAEAEVADLRFFDRSIAVGRHTSTGDYHAGLAPLRDLVNSLYEESCTTNLNDLLLDFPLPSVDPEINAFFRKFQTAWNAPIRQAIALTAGEPAGAPKCKTGHPPWLGTTVEAPDRVTPAYQAKVLEPALAEELRRIEWSHARGLGVGHSLIAVVYIS